MTTVAISSQPPAPKAVIAISSFVLIVSTFSKQIFCILAQSMVEIAEPEVSPI
jgi:hypothetical protein